MPSMADIIVKASNGTTDVTYTARAPSSGNNVQAIWSTAGGTMPAARGELRVSSTDSKDGKKRIVRGQFKQPMTATDSTTTVTSVYRTGVADFSFTFDKDMSQSTIDEQAAQFGNLLVSALIRAVLNTGYAPT